MSANLEAIVRGLLDEGLTDWIPIDRVIGAARELAPAAGVRFQAIATDLFSRLIEPGLMVPGSIGEAGFEPWSGSPDVLLRRAIAECESFDWQPQGAGCWLANTDK